MHTATKYRTHPLVLALALHILGTLRQRERDWQEQSAREIRQGWHMPYCVHGAYAGDPLYGYGALKKCALCEFGVGVHEEALGLARTMIRDGRTEASSQLAAVFIGNRALLTGPEQDVLFTFICRLAHDNVTF